MPNSFVLHGIFIISFLIKVYLKIIGWMTKTARSVMTARVYLRPGGASITVEYVVSSCLFG